MSPVTHDTSGRRPVHLDREIIIDTAREIFRRDGLSSLTLRRLGAELGVDATAMYRYFRNKAALITALIDGLFVDIPEPNPELTWRKNLMNLMVAWWRIYRENEGLSQAMAGQPDDEPRLFHLTEWTVRELIRAGIPIEELGFFQLAVYNHTVGNGLVAAFSPWLTTEHLRDEQRRIYASLDPTQFPSAVAAAPSLYPDTEDSFVFSTEVLLDAIERRAALSTTSQS